MILFTPDMAQAILDERKTVTRRRGKKRWNVGAIHQCYTRPPFAKGGAEPFARVRIVSVDREEQPGTAVLDGIRSGDVGARMLVEAWQEGFRSWPDFADTYRSLNGEQSMKESCWRVEFELVREAAS